MRRPRKSRQPIGATSSTGTRTATRGPTQSGVLSPSTPRTTCSRTRCSGRSTIGSWRQEHHRHRHRHRQTPALRSGLRRPEATTAGGRQALAELARRAADRGGRRRDRRHHRRQVPGIPGEPPAIGRHLHHHPRLTARAVLPAGLIQPGSRRLDWNTSPTGSSHGWCSRSASPRSDSPQWLPSPCERQLSQRWSASSRSRPRTSSMP